MLISTKIGTEISYVEVIFNCTLIKECNRLLLNTVLLMLFV